MHFVNNQLPCVLLACACACAAASAQAADAIDPRSLSEKTVTLLDVSKPGSPGKSFVAGTIINAPLEKLCAVIQDYASYPGFMPNTVSAKVAMSTPLHSVVDVTLKLPMGKIKKYRLRMDPQVSPGSCVVAWKQLPWKGLKQEETIADTKGYWQFTPAPTAGKTIVKYVVYTDPGPIPFGLGWIVDSLSKDSIPRTLDGLRKQAQKK